MITQKNRWDEFGSYGDVIAKLSIVRGIYPRLQTLLFQFVIQLEIHSVPGSYYSNTQFI